MVTTDVHTALSDTTTNTLIGREQENTQMNNKLLVIFIHLDTHTLTYTHTLACIYSHEQICRYYYIIHLSQPLNSPKRHSPGLHIAVRSVP